METQEKYVGIEQILPDTAEVDGQNPMLLFLNKAYVKTSSPHSHPYLEVFYFLEGEGRIESEEVSVPLRENTVLVVNARTVHVLKNDAKKLLHYSMLLDNIRLRDLPLNTVGSEKFIVIEDTPDRKIKNGFDRMIEELTEKKIGYILCVRGLVNEMLATLCRAAEKKETAKPKPSKTAQNAKDYIDLHYRTKITADGLAAALFINKYYLLHSFKKAYNTSPLQYLSSVRLQAACRFLQSTEKTVAEIAGEVGFDNPVYFAEQFKKHFGTTPSVYRKISRY